MSKLYFLSDIYTVNEVDKMKELHDITEAYMKTVDIFKFKKGDFVQLTEEYVKSRMIFNGKIFKPLPPDDDFLLIDKFPFNHFIQFSDIVSFDPHNKDFDIFYGNGYVTASNKDVNLFFVNKQNKKLNFNELDIYYSYGEDFIYEDIKEIDLNELMESNWLFKKI